MVTGNELKIKLKTGELTFNGNAKLDLIFRFFEDKQQTFNIILSKFLTK